MDRSWLQLQVHLVKVVTSIQSANCEGKSLLVFTNSLDHQAVVEQMQQEKQNVMDL